MYLRQLDQLILYSIVSIAFHIGSILLKKRRESKLREKKDRKIRDPLVCVYRER